MKIRLQNLWENLHASYWFIPSLMAIVAIAAALSGVALDREKGQAWHGDLWWIYNGGRDGASNVLSVIAGSIVTVAGVVFSVTVTAFTLASSQFGPRLLRGFMRDRGNQAVLGMFIATHLYCLLVLRTVRSTDDGDFVPHLSVTFGIALAIVSMGVLIYFIDHVAYSIQAPNIIAAVSADLDAAADDLFPKMLGHGASGEDPGDDPALPHDFERGAVAIPIVRSGYLCAVDTDTLLAIAVKHDLLLQLDYRPGHLLSEGRRLLLAWPADRVDEPVCRKLQRAFIVGPQRTTTQDIEFSIQQLVELGVRALSPGINDPFTAIACADHLGSCLRRLAQRKMPSPLRYDERGRLRVIAPAVTFPGLVEAAFNQLRQNGCGHVAVAIRLLEAITTIAEGVRSAADRDALLRQVAAIERASSAASRDEQDLNDVGERVRAARLMLAARGAFIRRAE